MRRVILLFQICAFCMIAYSCNTSQLKIDKTSRMIKEATEQKQPLSSADYQKIELEMQALEKDMLENRTNYSDEQLEEIGRLKGKYAALMLKKGMNDFKESVKDLGNQVEGFIEGITDSTSTKKGE
jgi:hypothetical protein